MKKIICILFVLFSFGKCLQAQTMQTIDSLGKIQQACLDEGRGMVGCVYTFKEQMDSIIELCLKKLYAKGNKASNLALQKNQENWLARQKIYNKKAEKKDHDFAVKEGFDHGSMERLFLADDITGFVTKRAEFLVKKLNSIAPKS
ncbi:MAG: hypothetical protein V4539_14500 [Bacteroidota bacterium]